MSKWFLFFLTIGSLLHASTLKLEIQYQEAQTGKKWNDNKVFEIPHVHQNWVSHPGMYKTLFVIELGNLIQKSLDSFRETPSCIRQSASCVREPGPSIQREDISNKLLQGLEQLQNTYRVYGMDVEQAIEMTKKLAENLLHGMAGPVFEEVRGRSTMAPKAASVCNSLHVTTGGVKDYSHFKKQVREGYVPVPDAFIMEGFISSFDLTIPGSSDQLIGLNPAYGIDVESRKLFVQVGMDSNVTAESFHRPPLNLAFVIDISGSMASTDNTERSRLEWAKDVCVQSISHLNSDDFISIVLFDNVSEILIPPTPVNDPKEMIAKVRSLQTRGSTNLDAGLRDGYRLVSQNVKEGYENRVILISDAGLNTGVTDPSTILRLIADHADEDIGLTAIGIGENFHYDFIHKVTMSKGGNAIFVHSGAELANFFKNFDFLVTPVAHHLKLMASFDGKLVKAYGVPMRKDEPLQDLINVRSLFFSQDSGGAIVLEFEYEPI